MTLTGRSRRRWRLIFWICAASATISAWFGYRVAMSAASQDPLFGAVTGVVTSLLITVPIVVFELQGQDLAVSRRLRRLPLSVYFAARVLLYVVVIVVGLALGRLLTDRESFRLAEIFESGGFTFSIAMAVIANAGIEIGRLLGFGTVVSLLSGRYARPRREQRAFLMIDMKGSTGFAERLGPERFLDLLNDFFRDVADGALECGAEIHKYVGDEAILTWRLAGPTVDSDMLACPFVIRDRIEEQQDAYRRHYGSAPGFRAALHCGEIVTGQIGDVRREIAFVGDTLNVAARLLDAARETGNDVLVSDELLSRAALPAGILSRSLPTLEVRGREARLAIAALDRP
ncbi:MAG: adenylate/guanylate cyclase domain-containing protein [Proteobacteria bacterium]|nr:adenylate/guanylate cyclase domain-containing protein [Pseudomonadota bacterium]